jgi:hypothetical protein
MRSRVIDPIRIRQEQLVAVAAGAAGRPWVIRRAGPPGGTAMAPHQDEPATEAGTQPPVRHASYGGKNHEPGRRP